MGEDIAEVPSVELQTAIRELTIAGVVIDRNADVKLTAEAQDRYNRTPWPQDRACTELTPEPSEANPAQRLAGRTFAHIAAISAANIWRTAPEKSRQAAMLSAGGEGT